MNEWRIWAEDVLKEININCDGLTDEDVRHVMHTMIASLRASHQILTKRNIELSMEKIRCALDGG